MITSYVYSLVTTKYNFAVASFICNRCNVVQVTFNVYFESFNAIYVTVRSGCVLTIFHINGFFSKVFNNSLTTIVDVGKILFSNTCDNSSFVRNVFVVTINVCHCYFAVVINCVFTWFNVFFISFGDTDNVTDVSSVINCIATRFKVSNIVITKI